MQVTASRELRSDLEPLPDLMKSLSVVRGYPVPWFVGWLNGEPEFRAADYRKIAKAVKDRLCWVCGNRLLVEMTFVIGPMCAINRISSEPPAHLVCARWSARNCPFLSKPQMHRRENDLPEDVSDGPGMMIKRNPGVTCLYTVRHYGLISDGRCGKLFHLAMAKHRDAVEWWALGKPATRTQVLASVESGLPILEKEAAQQPGGLEKLASMKRDMYQRFLPLE